MTHSRGVLFFMPGFFQQLVERSGPVFQTDFIKNSRKSPSCKFTKTQYIEVVHHQNCHRITIGASGWFTARADRFMVVPAQIVGEKHDIYYFLFYPSFSKVINQKHPSIYVDADYSSQDGQCDCWTHLSNKLLQCALRGSGVVIHRPEHRSDDGSNFNPQAHQEIEILLKAFGFPER